MNTQPEALRLADYMHDHFDLFVTSNEFKTAAELRRLHSVNAELMEAYRKMRNSAAGYSNYCDDNASVRRCERDFTEAEVLYRAAIAKAQE